MKTKSQRLKGTGALLDTRPREQKIKDYLFEEIVASADPVTWIAKAVSEWRKFPIFDQNGSGSCVAQTIAKLLGIMYQQKNGDYVHFSATHIYQRRSNRPQWGMIAINALEIAREGTTLEVLVPSQRMTDKEMDGTMIEPYKQEVGKVFKTGNYVILPAGDIEKVASTIQKTGKAVMVWFYFTRDEWTDIPHIGNEDLSIVGRGTVRHSVAAVDFIMHKGQKALIIEDSWGEHYGLGGQRIIKEDFFEKRSYFSAYPINFAFAEKQDDPNEQKPQHRFSVVLKFSPTFITHPDVASLQDILKYEGLFPDNVNSTGYYGAITAKAVLAFQRKYAIASEAELVSLQGRLVGPKTVAKLNKLYS